MINRQKLLVRTISLIFFIFVLDFMAKKFYWYSSIWYFDMVMHFLGGFWIAISLIWIFSWKDLTFSSIFKIILGFLIIAIGWETFEILIDQSITKDYFNALDTLSDLFLGMSGAIISLFYFSKRIMIKKEIKV